MATSNRVASDFDGTVIVVMPLNGLNLNQEIQVRISFFPCQVLMGKL